jgi:hypothetical protein
MATTNPTASARSVDDRRVVAGPVRRWSRETKPSFMTTEFWAMLAGIAALVVVYNVADNPSLDLWRTCLLATVIATAYIVSRGFAKSGSDDTRHDTDYDYR